MAAAFSKASRYSHFVADTGVILLFPLQLAHFLKHDGPGYPRMDFPSARRMICTVNSLFSWSNTGSSNHREQYSLGNPGVQLLVFALRTID